jgi:hypothetical protein
MAQASGMVREAQMRLVELPLDVAELQPPPVAALPSFWSADPVDPGAFFWDPGGGGGEDPYAIPGAEVGLSVQVEFS